MSLLGKKIEGKWLYLPFVIGKRANLEEANLKNVKNLESGFNLEKTIFYKIRVFKCYRSKR